MRFGVVVGLTVVGINFLALHVCCHRAHRGGIGLLEIEVGVVEMLHEKVNVLWDIGHLSVAERRKNDGFRRVGQALFGLLHGEYLAYAEL